MATKKQKMHGLDANELKVLVEKRRDELRGLRFSAAGSKNRNVKLARTLRREIARALTETNTQKVAQK